MSIKISVVIPYMQSDEGKPAILKRCTDSLTRLDELIIVSNWKEGYAKPINKGLALAKGDFIIVMNDDVILEEGTLDMLCDENAITSPLVNGQEQAYWGCVFCIPRWIYEQFGGLYEGYRISYFDDADFFNAMTMHGVKFRSVPEVKFAHPDGGRTLHTFPDHNEFFEENKKLFIERWGQEPKF